MYKNFNKIFIYGRVQFVGQLKLKFIIIIPVMGVGMELGRDGTKFIKKIFFLQKRDERNEHDI